MFMNWASWTSILSARHLSDSRADATTQSIITQSCELASETVRNLKTTIQGARCTITSNASASLGRQRCTRTPVMIFDEPTSSSQDRVVSLVDDLRERAP